jgi:hypothetical protein
VARRITDVYSERMKLPRVAAVVACVGLLAGCSAQPSLRLGGDGLTACVENPEDAAVAFAVPIQNSGERDVVITYAEVNTTNAHFGPAVLIGGFFDESEDTLSNLSAGLAADFDGLDGAPEAEGMTVPAHSRGQLAFTFTPLDGGGTAESITLGYDGGDLVASARVKSIDGECSQ